MTMHTANQLSKKLRRLKPHEHALNIVYCCAAIVLMLSVFYWGKP